MNLLEQEVYQVMKSHGRRLIFIPVKNDYTSIYLVMQVPHKDINDQSLHFMKVYEDMEFKPRIGAGIDL